MTLEIIRLRSSDVEPMRKLTAVFADAFEDREAYLSRPPADAHLRRFLSDDRCIALAAQIGGEIRGGLVAYELLKFEQERSEIYIYDLAVAANYRRRGVATALIQETRRIARRVGAWTIYVQADQGDDPAIALYSKRGAREDVIHFDIAPCTHVPQSRP